MSLHDELTRLADTASRPSIDPSVWDRGRALRRRDRLVASAVVLVIVVILGGLVTVVTGPPRAFAPADDPVPDGAIPSRIEDVPADAGLSLETDLAIGRASVAFVSTSGVPVVIGATDGRYHLLDLPAFPTDGSGVLALSPDGHHLAWSTAERIQGVDLRTGQVAGLVPNGGRGADVTAMAWDGDSARVTWQGRSDGEDVAGVMEFVGPSEQPVPVERILAIGLIAPTFEISARPTTSDQPDALFARPATAADRKRLSLGSDEAVEVPRPLPTDLYPDGASVRPLGWAGDSLVLAEVDAPTGSQIEGRHLALFTSPDRPESEWTFRILVRDLPSVPISLAADLVPDLDGTSNQQLTHDFGEPDWPGQRDISWIIGLGVAGALCVLYGLRWLWRRRTGLS